MPFLSTLTDAARTRWARIEATLRAHPLVWALVLSAAIAAVFVLTLSPGYDTNDDVGMQSAVDGTMGEHSPHLVFSNVLIGLLLSTLYRAVGWFPWYGLYLYAAHFAALLAVVYVVLADRRGHFKVRLLALGGVLAVFHLSMWMQLQFTSTAMLFGASGVMLYLAVAPREPARWGTIAVGGAMVGLSSWIRWHSGWAVVLLSVPVLVLTLRRLPWRRLALFAGTAAAILLAGSVAQAIYYADQPAWQTYFDFNAARDHIQQSPLLDQLDPAVLAEVGWSRNDLAIFDAWFFADERVHEAADVEVIADALPTAFRPAHALGVLAALAGGWLGATRLAVVVALAALAWVEGGRRAGALVLATSAAVLVIAFGLAGAYRLPDRVAVGLLAFPPLLFLSLPGASTPDGSFPRGRTGVWHGAAAIVSVIALVVGAANALALDRQHHAGDDDLREAFAGFAAVDPDGIFVAWGGQVQMGAQSLSPWRRGGLGGPRMILFGWPARSPAYEAQLTRLAIDDLYAAVAARPDVYLPMRMEARGGMYLRYLAEHYGFSGLLRPAARVGAYTVYQGVTSFEVESSAGALVERRFDGSVVSYRIVPAHGLGSDIVLPLWPRGFLIAGSADADLIVVTYRGEAIALARPDPALGGDSDSPGFALMVYRAGRPLRVFAISDGRAVNITP
ncbi:MAG: hypothetical protein A2V75_06995 [Actinobacteria bacterium RBG_16_70_17]|nr:MAG: hypothetical protein A2V75_06995 [Actinobacteria bacterium RBG_16_70_17]